MAGGEIAKKTPAKKFIFIDPGVRLSWQVTTLVRLWSTSARMRLYASIRLRADDGNCIQNLPAQEAQEEAERSNGPTQAEWEKFAYAQEISLSSVLWQGFPENQGPTWHSHSLLLPRSLDDEGRAVAKIYTCMNCSSVFDWDFIAAKNIMLKWISDHLMASGGSIISSALSGRNRISCCRNYFNTTCVSINHYIDLSSTYTW